MLGVDASSAGKWPRGRNLRVEGVTLRRKAHTILSGIDLDFAAGHRYVLVGASGAGKSSLLRLLNRLEDPSEGCIRIGQDDLRAISIRTLRTAVGLVFQSPRPLPGTVAENLEYPYSVRSLRLPDREQLAELLLEVGLEPRLLRRDAAELSGGERQRLAIAAALTIEPEILALDEPTAALDPASARRISDLLGERAETRGLRTIAVTHHRGHAPMLGDTAVLMDRGRIVEVGPLTDVLDKADSAWRENGEDR